MPSRRRPADVSNPQPEAARTQEPNLHAFRSLEGPPFEGAGLAGLRIGCVYITSGALCVRQPAQPQGGSWMWLLWSNGCSPVRAWVKRVRAAPERSIQWTANGPAQREEAVAGRGRGWCGRVICCSCRFPRCRRALEEPARAALSWREGRQRATPTLWMMCARRCIGWRGRRRRICLWWATSRSLSFIKSTTRSRCNPACTRCGASVSTSRRGARGG
jgi:hypothetical protein